MFGISSLGWIHTLGSLPAIPLALYMFVRHGRIVPRSRPGAIYFVCMIIGAATVFLVARQPISYVIGTLTLVVLVAGYGAEPVMGPTRTARYVETICLSLSAFFLMVPTVTEILLRVPDGHPFVTDPSSPVLRGAHGTLLVLLVVGLTAQIVYLARQGKALGRRA